MIDERPSIKTKDGVTVSVSIVLLNEGMLQLRAHTPGMSSGVWLDMAEARELAEWLIQSADESEATRTANEADGADLPAPF